MQTQLVLAALSLCLVVAGVDGLLGSKISSGDISKEWHRSSIPRSSVSRSHSHSSLSLHRLTVALKHHNHNTIRTFANEVSDLSHPSYGAYWTLDELTELTAASPTAISEVTEFFERAGAVAVHPVLTKDFLVVDIPVPALERLLSVKFDRFSHPFSSRSLLRTSEPWSLPHHIARHIELITGVSDFFESPSELRARSMGLRGRKRAHVEKQDCPATSAPDIGRVHANENSVTVPVVIHCLNGNTTSNLQQPCSETGTTASSITLRLVPSHNAHTPIENTFTINTSACSLTAAKTVQCVSPRIDVPTYARLNVSATVNFVGASSNTSYLPMLLATSPFVSPDTLFNLYKVPYNTRGTNPSNSIGVPAFELQYISTSDLKQFHQLMGLSYIAPTIVGQNDESNPGGESTLDIQYIMGVAPGVPARFTSVTGSGPAIPPGQGAYILEWAVQVSNDTSPPLVTSISYGDTEDGYFNKFGDYSYINRMETELAKMAVRGLTVLAGSGDAGVSNVGEQGNDISPTDPTCTPFRAFYPSNSPYVTSVSSTYITRDHLPVCSASIAGVHSVECAEIGESAVSVRDGIFWTTGGGFSNMSSNPTASWQKDWVSSYLSSESAVGTLPPTDVFNAGGRGYPDVATVGHNLMIVWNGALTTVDGTSASGPIMAGLVALWNDARLNAGLPPLGLLNPFLYAAKSVHYDAFRDVVVGSNYDGDVQARCAAWSTYCPYGFNTRAGWTPVTGLGTPNWPVLKQLALNPKLLADNFRSLMHQRHIDL